MTNQNNDKHLTARLQNNKTKRESFSEVVELYQQRLYWHIRKMVVSHDDARDVLQEVFIRVWNGAEKFKGDAPLAVWLYKIAGNESLRFLEKLKKRTAGKTGLEEILIQKLETEMGVDAERTIKSYDLGDATADDAKQLLEDAFGDLEFLSGGAPDKLVIRADEAAHAKIAQLIEELKEVVAVPEETIKVYPFEEDELDVTTVYQALSPADMEALSIQISRETNSLIVRGRADRHRCSSTRLGRGSSLSRTCTGMSAQPGSA